MKYFILNMMNELDADGIDFYIYNNKKTILSFTKNEIQEDSNDKIKFPFMPCFFWKNINGHKVKIIY